MRLLNSLAVLVPLLLSLSAAPALAVGSISGSVVGADGTALPCGINIEDADGEWITWVECQPAGHYTITNLDAGLYRLTAEVPDQPQYYDQYYPGTIFWDEAEQVSVIDDQDTTGIDFTMTMGGSMSGIVLGNQSSEAIEGAWVEIHTPDWRFSQLSMTSSDGTYLIEGIPPTTFLADAYVEEGVWVSQYWDHSLDSFGAEALVWTGTEATTDINFDLFREAVITGTIVSVADGSPIADAYVSANSADYTVNRDGSSDEDGNFRLNLLPPGSYFVWADAEGFGQAPYVDDDGEAIQVSVTEGGAAGGVIIELQAGGAISGRVIRTSDGSPVVSGYAGAWQPETYEGGSADTDENGNFRIEGLPAGDYVVYAEGDQGENLVPTLLTNDAGELELVHVEIDSEVEGILLSLEQGGMITGRVLSNEDGSALQSVYVYAEEIDGDNWRDAYSDDNGDYQLSGLGTADYVVVAEHPDFVHQAYDGAVLDFTATPVQVESGSTVEGIDFHLDRAGGISGRVVDASTGDPIEDIWVEAFFNEDTWLPGAWTFTDENGDFLLQSVIPGEQVFVIAYDAEDRYAWQWFDGALAFELATSVDVDFETVTTGVDFALQQPGLLSFTPASLSFEAETYQEDIDSQTLVVTNNGPGPAIVEVWSEDDWLCVDYDDSNLVLNSGESLTVEVTAWPWGLNAGAYTDQVIVANWLTGEFLNVDAALTLTPAAPILAVEPSEIWFDGEEGAASPSNEGLWLVNLGDGEINVTITDDADWLRVTPTQGSLQRGEDPVEMIVRANTSGLVEGDYTATITVDSEDGTWTIQVYLYVSPAVEGDPEIVTPERVTILIPGGLSMKAMKDLASATFDIANEGEGDLHWSARSDDEWVEFEPDSGTIAAGDASTSVTITADPEQLFNGMNSTFLEIGSSRATAKVEIDVQLGSEASSGAVQPGDQGHLVIPVLVHAAGLNESQFVSDLWISHLPSGRKIDVTLTFVPEDTDGTEAAVSTRLEMESGQTISLLDVMANWLGGNIPKGSLIILSDDIDEVESSSRTYNSSKSGTFGQEIPALPSRSGITRLDGSLHIAGLAASAEPSSGFRSNLLLTEVSGRPVQAEVKLFDAAGNHLGTTNTAVKPFATKQINNIFARAGYSGSASGARAEVSIIQGNGRLVAIGSTIDNVTNDPNTLLGQRKNASVRTTIIPVVANAPGVGGTLWISDVAIANVDSISREVTVSYTTAAGEDAGSVIQEIAAGETWLMGDVVGETFDKAGTRGVLRIDGDPAGGLAISSRTYNLGEEGTFGQGISGIPLAKALRQGSDVLRLIALNNTDRYRTNVGFSEVLGEAVRIGIVLFEQHGTRVLGYREVDVPAKGQFQTNIFDAIGMADSNVVSATAIIQVVSGDGAIMAYASMVDNQSTDATTLPPPERVAEGDLTTPQGGPPGGPAGERP